MGAVCGWDAECRLVAFRSQAPAHSVQDQPQKHSVRLVLALRLS